MFLLAARRTLRGSIRLASIRAYIRKPRGLLEVPLDPVTVACDAAPRS